MTNPSSFQEIILKLQDFYYLNRPEGSLGKILPDIQTFGTVHTIIISRAGVRRLRRA
jgi:hypothetical protein